MQLEAEAGSGRARAKSADILTFLISYFNADEFKSDHPDEWIDDLRSYGPQIQVLGHARYHNVHGFFGESMRDAQTA